MQLSLIKDNSRILKTSDLSQERNPVFAYPVGTHVDQGGQLAKVMYTSQIYLQVLKSDVYITSCKRWQNWAKRSQPDERLLD